MAPAGGQGPLGLLRQRDFLGVWLAGALTGNVRWLEMLVAGVYIFDQTGSPFLVALIAVARLAPLAVVGALTGAVTERVGHRRLFLIGNVVMLAVAILLAVAAYGGILQVWHVFTGAFATGLFWTSDLPARRALLGNIAGEDRVAQAMGLDAATNNFNRMLGPALGGILLAGIGIEGAYLLAVLFYLASLAAMLMVRADNATRAGVGVFSSLLEGFRLVRADRALTGTLIVTVIFNVWGFPYTSMIPVIGAETLALGPDLVGLLAGTEGAGALTGALLIAAFARAAQFRTIYFFGTLLFMTATLAFAWCPWPTLSAAILLIGGLGGAGFATMQSTIIFLSAPPAAKSRMMGILSVAIGTGPIGFLHIGWLADSFGAPAAVTISALEGLTALALVWWFYPEIRGRRENEAGTPAA